MPQPGHGTLETGRDEGNETVGIRVGKGVRSLATALVLAVVLAACGGGGGEDEVQADQDTGDATTQSEGGEAGGDDTTDDAATTDDPSTDADVETGTDGGEAPPPADSGGAGDSGGTSGGQGTTPPANSGGSGGSGTASKPVDDAGALAKVLRIEDLPAGYQQNEEYSGPNEEQERFAESFEKCMGAAGVDASGLAEPTGQAGRSFSDGPGNAQEPDEVGAGVIGFADTGAAQGWIGALDALFSSKPGRDCVANEVEKALEAEIQQIAPGATVEVEAQASTAYAPAGAHAQVRLITTVTIGVQEIVYVTDIVTVQAGGALGTVTFTNQDSAFDPAVGRPIVDKALARLG